MNCPICKSTNPQFIYKFADSSAMQHKLHFTLDSALNEEKVSVNLYGCEKCGFVFNADFDVKKTQYSSNYDNTQSNSGYFNSYLVKLAKRLNKKYKLANKKVVEVGCGKGHFLKILYDLGIKNVKGFDPSYIANDPIINRLVEKKFFNRKNIKEKADFIICRHTLEHISDPAKFVYSLAGCLAEKGVIYFEFPDLEWIVKNKVFFDFFYEHCNYFTKKSLIALFGRFGFENITFNYGLKGQYFQLEISRFPAKKNPGRSDLRSLDFSQISNFINEKISAYKKITGGLNNFAILGAGAKGVTFLNRLKINRERCRYVIDINPNKQNKFIPITGQKIVSPEILKKTKIDNIIIMNPIYEKEIKAMAAKYNYKGKFIII